MSTPIAIGYVLDDNETMLAKRINYGDDIVDYFGALTEFLGDKSMADIAEWMKGDHNGEFSTVDDLLADNPYDDSGDALTGKIVRHGVLPNGATASVEMDSVYYGAYLIGEIDASVKAEIRELEYQDDEDAKEALDDVLQSNRILVYGQNLALTFIPSMRESTLRDAEGLPSKSR